MQITASASAAMRMDSLAAARIERESLHCARQAFETQHGIATLFDSHGGRSGGGNEDAQSRRVATSGVVNALPSAAQHRTVGLTSSRSRVASPAELAGTHSWRPKNPVTVQTVMGRMSYVPSSGR